MDGEMDEVRVWNYVRSGSQIAGAMHSSIPVSDGGLEAYWPMSSGDSLTVRDVSGKGHDVGMPSGYFASSWSADAPQVNAVSNTYRYGFNGKEDGPETGHRNTK